VSRVKRAGKIILIMIWDICISIVRNIPFISGLYVDDDNKFKNLLKKRHFRNAFYEKVVLEKKG